MANANVSITVKVICENDDIRDILRKIDGIKNFVYFWAPLVYVRF